MSLYVENHKDFKKNLLDLINEFTNVAVYKSSIQKSMVFLYTSNKLFKKEIKKRITSQ